MGRKTRIRVTPNQINVIYREMQWYHWVILIVMTLIIAGALCLASARFQINHVNASDIEALLNNSADDKAFKMFQAGKAHEPPPDCILFGASSATEALESDSILERQIREYGNQSIHLLNLCTSGQSFLDILFLWSQIPSDNKHASVMIFITPSYFCRSAVAYSGLKNGDFIIDPTPFARKFSDRIPFLKSWTATGAARMTHIRIMRSFLYRSIHNRLQNWYRRAVYHYPAYRIHHYEPADAISHDIHRIQSHRRRVRKFLHTHYKSCRDRNRRIFRVLLQEFRKSNVRVYLFEAPIISGDVQNLFREVWEDYQGILRKNCNEFNIKYVNLNQSIALSAADFFDCRHVNSSGREKWSRGFTRWFAAASDYRL